MDGNQGSGIGDRGGPPPGPETKAEGERREAHDETREAEDGTHETAGGRRQAEDPDVRRFVVEADQAGQRLDLFLAALMPDQSRSSVQRLIKEGRVSRGDNRAARANMVLRAGEEITIEVPPPVAATPEPEALPIPIVYEDRDIVVVDKPAGMVVHPAAGHFQGTLVNALLHHVDDLSGIGGEQRPGIVHRLDRGTSGLLVVAKHDAAHRALVRQFQDREIEKEYVALAWGLVHAGRRIDTPIGRDPHDRKKMSSRAPRARDAMTRVLRAQFINGVSLLHLSIATGRTHQIRVHLSAIGHPVVGDQLYGGVHRRVGPDLRPILRLERPFLHAARLAFNHPGDARRMEFEAPLPDDLQGVLDDLLQNVRGAPASPKAKAGRKV
ncbi:MAG: RluA family pseudouridine synthase [Bacteroidales bacterium]